MHKFSCTGRRKTAEYLFACILAPSKLRSWFEEERRENSSQYQDQFRCQKKSVEKQNIRIEGYRGMLANIRRRKPFAEDGSADDDADDDDERRISRRRRAAG